ncbi:MAG: hypothetical protein FWG83_06895 [Oscillospiraceae bacterium]|nr:hypothetical protein [Oscillospiraceae bacterium]
MIKIKLLFLILISLFLLTVCSNSNSKPLNSDEWGIWDIGYNPERYNMTLWLFETGWFKEKTEENILTLLPDRNINEIIDNEVSFQVRFHNPNSIIGIDPHVTIGILNIYFDNGIVVRAEYRERKNADSAYDLILEWQF